MRRVVVIPVLTSLPVSAPVLGRVEPRLWTPPLRELTPETSAGFDQIDFAKEILGFPFDPWQEWLVIHAGELLPDGRPRFRRVFVIVARQNGKSTVPRVLCCYWSVIEAQPLILGTSNKLEHASRSWRASIKMMEASPVIGPTLPKRWYREANGQERWRYDGSEYMIAAANADGGRSETINRLFADELREHHNRDSWNATVPAMSAVPDAQAWFTSNAGTDASLVLNEERASALADIAAGNQASRVGWFEWSAPEGSDPEDVQALAMANPNLGHRKDLGDLLDEARTAKAAGGETLAGFLTESLCIHVKHMDPAVDAQAWSDAAEPGELPRTGRRVALCVDVSMDGAHATLCAAAVLPDGRVRVKALESWTSTAAMRRELPGLVRRVRPAVLGWLPGGPAAAVSAGMATLRVPGTKVEEITGEVVDVCMGLAELVKGGRLVHAGQELLNAHVTGAEKLRQGDRWRFTRKGAGHVDAAYAAAGAAHLAQLIPVPVGPPVVVPNRDNT